MIIEKKNKKGIWEYIVDKEISDEKADKLEGTTVKPKQINFIIDHDADVYTKEGKLLLRFRKKILNSKKVEEFYKNVIKFAMNYTANRGTTSGQKKGKKDIRDNPKIRANILGYMDGFAPSQKVAMRQKNLYTPLAVRETRFNQDYPDNWKKALPMIEEIDYYYKKLLPTFYKKQKTKADETYYRIANTAFTTITTNVNFKTHLHKDAGDDSDGYGNLVVMEDGEYKGSETCFPQYGVGVDVRQDDVLFMDVHKWHANLPMKPANKNVKRMSVVCYLRLNIWKRTRGLSKKRIREHDEKVRKLGKHPARPNTAKRTKTKRGKTRKARGTDDFVYNKINFL